MDDPLEVIESALNDVLEFVAESAPEKESGLEAHRRVTVRQGILKALRAVGELRGDS